MKNILIYPPFADPTQPYIALPVLKSYLNAKGFDVTAVDLNIAAVHYLSGKVRLQQLAARVKTAFGGLNSKTKLTAFEQLAYLQLRQALQESVPLLLAGNSPVAFFTGKKKPFFDYAQYHRAADAMEKIFEAYNSLAFPYQFGFNFAGHFLLPWSLSLLEDYIREEHSLLKDFYAESLPGLVQEGVKLIGISLTFISQLPECFYLCSRIRQLCPDSFIVLGGSCISQIMFCAPASVRSWLFAYADGICTGEGEETLAALLALPGALNTQHPGLASVPNLTTREADGQLITGPGRVFDIGNAPPPDYSDYNLDAYLAPSRLLLYAPARHCYWRRCSFCTYGFSYAGAHHYQEIPAQKAAEELAALAQQYGTENFYFSCDVLSPRYAEELARALLKQGSTLHWSVDLRIEKQYTPELCSLLYAAGLHSAAFGIESGSDAVLALIDKGTDVSTIKKINANFHKAGIATQWMTFTYHPGEKAQDAAATLNLLEQEQALVDLFVAGEFQLIPGSRIMAEPAKYGISRIYYLAGDEFRLYPLYTLENPGSSDSCCREKTDRRIDLLAEKYALRRYPWAGAISTHHSLLYFLEYGTRVFAEKAALKKQLRAAAERSGLGKPPYCAFSLEKIRENKECFYRKINEAMQPNTAQPGLNPEETTLTAPLSGKIMETIANKIRPVINRSKRLPQIKRGRR